MLYVKALFSKKKKIKTTRNKRKPNISIYEAWGNMFNENMLSSIYNIREEA